MPRLTNDDIHRGSDFSGISDVLSRAFNKGYNNIIHRVIEMEALLAELLEKYSTVLMRLDVILKKLEALERKLYHEDDNF